MPVLPSIQYGDLKGNHTISGTAEPNARVLLYNPAEGRYVRAVDADASGNFDFGSLNSSVPLQIKVVGSNDFTCEATSPTVKPAAALQLNNGKMIIKPHYLPGADGQNYFITGPKGVFIDRNGPGSGAAIEFQLASSGDVYPSPGTDVPYDPYVYGDPPYIPSVGGHPLKSYTMTSFGQGYVDPVLVVTGTVRTYASSNGYGWSYLPGINPATGETYKQQYPGGVIYEGTAPPPPEHFAGYGWEVSQNTWWGKLDTHEEIPCYTSETQDSNNVISNITSRWGASNTWGQYTANGTYGPRLNAQVPGYSNIDYNVSCSTEDSTQPGPALQEKLAQIWMEGWAPNAEATLTGANYGLYLKLIHGHSGETLGTATNKVTGQAANNLDNSALVAMNNGVIFYEELAYLKGWIATEVQVKPMVNRYTQGWASYVAANSAIFNNYVYKPLLTWITDFALVSHNINDAFRRWEPNSNASQYFGLGPSFAKEWQDAAVQSVGAFDSVNDRGIARVRSILTKLGNHYGSDFTNSITTTDSTGTYRWNFTGNTLQKVQL